MRDSDPLEDHREAIRDSVRYFSVEQKAERERYVVKAFLKRMGIAFAEEEVRSVEKDPPDVAFRDARFEVKEIMDEGRERHREYKEKYMKALEATEVSQLFRSFIPKTLDLLETYRLVVEESLALMKKYPASACANLDLLFYINLLDVMRFDDSAILNMSTIRLHPWRSVSFVLGPLAGGVLAARESAPEFLKDLLGQIITPPPRNV